MWIIENDGDVFNGKRIWLRPGKKFLFGRTGVESGGFAINNKTISRKHLTVEIGTTTLDDATRLDVRSKLILEDLNTKIGTTVNGEQIKGTVRILQEGDKFEVKLAHFENLFRISWLPCNLAFSFTGKELKSDPVTQLCQKLAPLDIKVDVNYHQNTTQVVAAKRNTSKGLQALINGRYIVGPSYVDAIVAAATSEDGGPSALELDYDGNWPKPSDYLPPKGAEATNRPEAAYAPDQNRIDIFEGYTFVFYSRPQFDNLLAPITNGRGKALFRDVDPEATEIDDFVGYVKNVAGEKGLGTFDDGSEGKGVVVVRFIPAKGATIGWYESFVREVSLRLDHRMIEQSEFLDAILNNDASVLRRALEIEPSTAFQSTAATGAMEPPSNSSFRAPNSPISPQRNMQDEPNSSNALPESSAAVAEPTSSAPPRRMGRSRRPVTSRFKGFDDFDIPETVPEISQVSSMAAQEASQSLFVSQNSEMDVGPDDRTSHKRPASPLIEESEEDIMEALAPAASKLKRQKMVDRRQRGESTPPPAQQVKRDPVATKPQKRQKPEIDILEYTRQQREKAEDLARQERESLQNAMDGMDIEAIRNLAIIEEMPLRATNKPSRHATTEDDPRWDEKWNGRKNFKKFRRRGEGGNPSRGQKVIVHLEEVKRKDFGIGDEYWLESGTGTEPSNTNSQDRSQSQSQKGKKDKGKQPAQQAHGNKSNNQPATTSQTTGRRSQRSNLDEVQIIASDDDDIIEEIPSNETLAHEEDEANIELPDIQAIVSEPLPRFQSRQTKAAIARQSQRSQATTSSINKDGKRPADEQLSVPVPSKKAKGTSVNSSLAASATLTAGGESIRSVGKGSLGKAPSGSRRTRQTQTQDDDDEDSDDGLLFRFGRRRG